MLRDWIKSESNISAFRLSSVIQMSSSFVLNTETTAEIKDIKFSLFDRLTRFDQSETFLQELWSFAKQILTDKISKDGETLFSEEFYSEIEKSLRDRIRSIIVSDNYKDIDFDLII